jgi:hypothetical protein
VALVTYSDGPQLWPNIPWCTLPGSVGDGLVHSDSGKIPGGATLKGRSVWPAVIGHAAVNGIGSLGTLFVRGHPNPLLGPAPAGVIGGLGLAIIALLIFVSARGLAEPEQISERV